MFEKFLRKYEQELKWFALALGIISTIAIVQDWYPFTMFVSLPFCLIWVSYAWLRTERQLKYINYDFRFTLHLWHHSLCHA